MLSKVLIANRGEIALRVIAACREAGLATVAVHSEADRDCLHVRLADQAVCIGSPPAKASYLNIASVIAAAEITGADAVHPGYGFLAENAHFAEVVQECGLTWIGPPPAAIRLMGDKAQARRTAAASGVPILPGSAEPLRSREEALALAAEIGFPVILKASAGGGGKGMRVAADARALHQAFDTARMEADRAFGNDEVYLEKYLDCPRHIEVQILADSAGRTIALGERECSIQRRHQKLIEEAPSTAVDEALREQMCDAAVAVAQAVGYRSAGTVEFLFQDGRFYFMEMNTRIQVEHPVTEAVTGVDLVLEQLRIAAGLPLGLRRRPPLRGHAIELRINAEDPQTFTPSAGLVTELGFPVGPGVRVDSHLYRGYRVPPTYDSLIAKVIVFGRDRQEAVRRARRALDTFLIGGIKTSIPLHRRILDEPDFLAGRLSTHFLDRLFRPEAET
ncbi:MAG TPA: acetyl-CoA carboxylase biotin carboxylase subunit [Thermoanaerobaculaceae bacterium]|nr:acetyl-CoA carboxylase biotin carboxylase subunit [Thermoanaerobaculaceae bacterium]HRS17123.1 acetyl-CoA carboxylase biotin carboxylase subunit [Thermoanaerobaculaceae bacterium]